MLALKQKIILLLIICLSFGLFGCDSKISDAEIEKIVADKYEEYKNGEATFEDVYNTIDSFYDISSNENIALCKKYVNMSLEDIGNGQVKSNKVSSDLEVPNLETNLQIQEGWTWVIDGNYSYIRGRVKNIGNESISYFEVTAEYLDDKGNVLDSDYTNSGQTLNSGDMKEFEIMHENNSEYKKARIYVNEVNFQ